MGFSYADTPAGCSHTDTSTAVDNHAALVAFYALFPELRPNEFFITGESYVRISPATPFCAGGVQFSQSDTWAITYHSQRRGR